MDDIGQGDLAAIAALSRISMGNIPKIRCAAQNALSSLAQKGDLLAIEPLDIPLLSLLVENFRELLICRAFALRLQNY